jgi:hypothetical protein
LRCLFWTLAIPTGALAVIVLLMTIAGRQPGAATPAWLSLLASMGVLGLLARARRVAAAGERPGMACWITVSSWAFFAIVMPVNGIARQALWN